MALPIIYKNLTTDQRRRIKAVAIALGMTIDTLIAWINIAILKSGGTRKQLQAKERFFQWLNSLPK